MKAKSASRMMLSLLLMALAPGMRAGSLGSSVIGMFPKDVAEIAYADLSQARAFPWFAQFEAQALPVPFHNFEQFVKSPGLGINSHVDQVAWALIASAGTSSSKTVRIGGQLAGVATGRFDPETARVFLEARNVRRWQTHDYTLYASSSGSGSAEIYFAFIDTGTIAFGPLEALERLIDVHDGSEENLLENEIMLGLINQANGDGLFWGVLNSSATQAALQQLVPEAARFPESEVLIKKMKALLITVQNSSNIETRFQAVAASPEDAVVLSQLLQAGVLLRKYQMNGDNPDLAQLLDSVRIAPIGDQLVLSFDLTADQLIGLIERNTFARLM